MVKISEALEIALQQHRAGRLDLAEEIDRRILAVEPELAAAAHLLSSRRTQMLRNLTGQWWPISDSGPVASRPS